MIKVRLIVKLGNAENICKLREILGDIFHIVNEIIKKNKYI